jgi:hypothetical protein
MAFEVGTKRRSCRFWSRNGGVAQNLAHVCRRFGRLLPPLILILVDDMGDHARLLGAQMTVGAKENLLFALVTDTRSNLFSPQVKQSNSPTGSKVFCP